MENKKSHSIKFEIYISRYQARWEVVMKQCLVEVLKRIRIPETFVLDRQRLLDIQARRHWMLTVAALVNTAMATPLANAKVQRLGGIFRFYVIFDEKHDVYSILII